MYVWKIGASFAHVFAAADIDEKTVPLVASEAIVTRAFMDTRRGALLLAPDSQTSK